MYRSPFAPETDPPDVAAACALCDAPLDGGGDVFFDRAGREVCEVCHARAARLAAAHEAAHDWESATDPLRRL